MPRGAHAPAPRRSLIVRVTFTVPQVAAVGHTMASAAQDAPAAVRGRVPVEVLADAIPPFPTRSEIWLRLWEKAGF